MVYKNTSFATKVFYGVEFKHGDIKDVPGYINDSKFVLITDTKLINELHQIKSKVKEKSTKVDSTPPVKNEQIEE